MLASRTEHDRFAQTEPYQLILLRKGVSYDQIHHAIRIDVFLSQTLGALNGMLRTIATYDLPYDYVNEREDYVRSLDADEHQRLAEKYIDPDRMVYLVVGDALTQKDQLIGLGLGEPIMLSTTGEQ